MKAILQKHPIQEDGRLHTVILLVLEQVEDCESERGRVCRIELDLLHKLGSVVSKPVQKKKDGTLTFIQYHRPKDEEDLKKKMQVCKKILAGYCIECDYRM